MKKIILGLAIILSTTLAHAAVAIFNATDAVKTALNNQEVRSFVNGDYSEYGGLRLGEIKIDELKNKSWYVTFYLVDKKNKDVCLVYTEVNSKIYKQKLPSGSTITTSKLEATNVEPPECR